MQVVQLPPLLSILSNTPKRITGRSKVADASYELVMSKIGNHPRAKGIHFLADDTQKRREYVQNADVSRIYAAC